MSTYAYNKSNPKWISTLVDRHITIIGKKYILISKDYDVFNYSKDTFDVPINIHICAYQLEGQLIQVYIKSDDPPWYPDSIYHINDKSGDCQNGEDGWKEHPLKPLEVDPDLGSDLYRCCKMEGIVKDIPITRCIIEELVKPEDEKSYKMPNLIDSLQAFFIDGTVKY